MANQQLWHGLAALSGAAAVSLGAYGAHGFKPKDPYFLEVFDRGNKYHLLHSLLLAVTPLARKPNAVGICTTAGILLFSGSCYAAAFTEDRANAKLAPFGGIALITAWLCLAIP
ncbi:g1892 [Coccomyxa elongata]